MVGRPSLARQRLPSLAFRAGHNAAWGFRMKVLAELSSHLVHDQTLLGAVDSFLKELVHVRPYRLSQYEAALAALVDAWFAHAGRNQLVAVDESWLQQYLATTADAAATRQVVD